MKLSDSHLLLKAAGFAADKHRDQRRKDEKATPYINHPLRVALTLVDLGREEDPNTLVAAILHDTIEDTETTPSEIEELFGKDVLSIVLELTDDKSLIKEERKRMQVVNAPHKSVQAKRVKLADKICNIEDIISSPPSNWDFERKLSYLQWAENVSAGLTGANKLLEDHLTHIIRKGRTLFSQEEKVY